VLGHEIYGRVLEAGRDAGVREGDRVVVEPLLSCAARGFAPACERCARGEPGLCVRVTEGALGAGAMIGFCAALPGGWSETIVAHRSQLVRVPDAVSDEAAVLLEPLSVGVHAALKRPARDGERVLVIGGGMIAYAVLTALELLECPAQIVHLALLPFQAELGQRLGADVAWTTDGTLDDRVEALTGARRLRSIFGEPLFQGGFDVVYDCVGSAASLAQSLRYARPGGAIVLVGCAARVDRLDLTLLWAHELQIFGSYTYGAEPSSGQRTFEIAAERLASRKLPLDALVTHRFPLESYGEAIVANLDRAKHRSVKTVFDNREARA
jgi:threonine dehydrogenase-like Zn-dependent dehydrogenase